MPWRSVSLLAIAGKAMPDNRQQQAVVMAEKCQRRVIDFIFIVSQNSLPGSADAD
jgi:hypothetical protein